MLTSEILAGTLGLLIGLAVKYLITRRSQSVWEQARLALETERATLFAKSEHYERTEKELKETQEYLRKRLEQESFFRASAEATSLRVPSLEAEVIRMQQENAELLTVKTQLQTEISSLREQHVERMSLLEQVRQNFTDAFQALSAESLKHNNASFLELAKTSFEKLHLSSQSELEKREQAIHHLVDPLKQTLEKLDTKINQAEKERKGDTEGLHRQISLLLESEHQLRAQTAGLVQALRSPTVRGRWGELQLRRVVELAGMERHCDFEEQSYLKTEEGALRPDLTVRLPGKKTLVVDAKTPLEAYLNAIHEPEDGKKKAYLLDYASQIKSHMKQLASKSYWAQFPVSPEFVILFLPGEMFFSAALQEDPTLIEKAANHNVILATPTTLIALLKTVAYGFRQEDLSERVQKISELGRELCKRLFKLGEHFHSIGKNLGDSVKAYNHAVGSLESRVWVTARKFQELQMGAGETDEISSLQPIESLPRALPAKELSVNELPEHLL